MRIVLLVTCLVAVSCSLIHPKPKMYKEGKRSVYVGYDQPEPKWRCKELGMSHYRSDGKTYIGVIHVGESMQDALESGSKKFAKAAAKKGGNYVNRSYHSRSGITGIAVSADEDYGYLYKCSKLPKKFQ
jgi:hypothetical protein